MDEPTFFYAVIEVGVVQPIARIFDDLVDADKAAKVLAINNPGSVFSVVEPKIGSAYRAAAPRAENVYLMWSAKPGEEEPLPPPSPPPADYMAGAMPVTDPGEALF